MTCSACSIVVVVLVCAFLCSVIVHLLIDLIVRHVHIPKLLFPRDVLCTHQTSVSSFPVRSGSDTYSILLPVYAISFMCTLNTRRVTRGRGTDREGTTSQAANLYTGNFYMVHHRPSQRSHPSQVHSPHTKVGSHFQCRGLLTDALHRVSWPLASTRRCL